MAKVTMNQVLEALQGGVGKLVFRQRPDGTIIISGAPSVRKGKATPKQKAHRQRFKEASRYAKYASKLHPIYAQLAATVGASSWKSAYNYALSDWFEAPVIHCIEPREDCVRIQASDNVLVANVHVSILDESGTILETGEAVRAEDDWWEYPVHATGKTIQAEARDLPGHTTNMSLRAGA